MELDGLYWVTTLQLQVSYDFSTRLTAMNDILLNIAGTDNVRPNYGSYEQLPGDKRTINYGTSRLTRVIMVVSVVGVQWEGGWISCQLTHSYSCSCCSHCSSRRRQWSQEQISGGR